MAQGGRISVGRAPGNDVVLEHPSVSRRHMEIEPHDEGIDLHDLGSSGGTHVVHNQRWVQVQHATVERGEPLRLGEFETTADAPC